MSEEITKAGFTHPCKETCSGYKQAAAEERERLSKLAPEFDEEWVRSFVCVSFDDANCNELDDFIGGALWQHTQLAPVIGALREENENLLNQLGASNSEIMIGKQTIAEFIKETDRLCKAVHLLAFNKLP